MKNKQNGGSSALDGCLRSLQWEDSYHFHSNKVIPVSSLTKSRAAIGLLFERGARWRPDARTIADVRKALYHIDPAVITEITDRLRDHHACDDGVLHELVRTPKMQELLRAYRRSKLEAEGAIGSRRNRNDSAVALVPKPQRLPAAVTRYLSQYDVCRRSSSTSPRVSPFCPTTQPSLLHRSWLQCGAQSSPSLRLTFARKCAAGDAIQPWDITAGLERHWLRLSEIIGVSPRPNGV